MKRPATRIIIGLLFTVALINLLRIILHIDVEVHDTLLPRWVSLVTFTAAVSLGVMLAHEND